MWGGGAALEKELHRRAINPFLQERRSHPPHLGQQTVGHTVNVDFLRIEYMVLAKYQHMSILELILLVKQHILILCKNLLGVDVLIIVN